MNLKGLLRPQTVAVVGASERLGFGRDATENLLKGDLGENLFLVHPKREQVLGRRCYKSLTEIGRAVDLVVICTPMDSVNQILEEAARCHAKGAVVYASGYSESGEAGRQAQQELLRVAREQNIALCGPNCGGFINNVDGVFAFGLLMPQRRSCGNIGLVSQSGQVCSLLASVPHLNFSYAISSGNNAVIGVEDYLEFFVEDEATEVIAFYLEGVKQPARFVSILKRAAEARKPVIALKVGASEKARQTTTAHTGSLAGSDATFDALFRKYGVIRVDDMEDMVNTCLLFSTLRHPFASKQIAIMNISGGEAAISADMALRSRVGLAELSEETKQTLKSLLPGYAAVNNPLDMTATLVFELEKYQDAVRAMLADASVGAVVMGHNPPEKVPERDRKVDFGFAHALAALQETMHKPIILLPGMARKRDEELREFYTQHHIPILDSPQYGFAALRRYADFCNYHPQEHSLEAACPEKALGERRVMSEHESKQLLAQYGIPVPAEYTARNEEELCRAAAAVGYPLVIKIDSPDIPHKTEVGGVRLGIQTQEEALVAFREILQNGASAMPQAKINGVLVQQMLPKGAEMILGINCDAQFGPMLLVGMGGIFVELFQDAALYPAPINKAEALAMIHSLKADKLLQGYRGSRPLDTEALADTMVKLGRLAVEKKDELKELDINPIFVYEQGVYAADALIVTNK